MEFPVEIYTPERRAEFLITNATDPDDFCAAADAVREMGIDPARIPHEEPSGS